MQQHGCNYDIVQSEMSDEKDKYYMILPIREPKNAQNSEYNKRTDIENKLLITNDGGRRDTIWGGEMVGTNIRCKTGSRRHCTA